VLSVVLKRSMTELVMSTPTFSLLVTCSSEVRRTHDAMMTAYFELALLLLFDLLSQPFEVLADAGLLHMKAFWVAPVGGRNSGRARSAHAVWRRGPSD
jgi:hypothetical protein